jgi:hypothetical protein
MISILKTEIESKINRTLLGRGDCEYLSKRIIEETGNSLSYNTLKRVFKIDAKSNVKPRESTLNVLSTFIGYNSYEDFKKEKSWSTEWFLQLKVNGLIDRIDEKEILFELSSPWILKKDFLVSFVTLIRELFFLTKIDLIDVIFKKGIVKFNTLSYSESLYLGNGIGSIMRKTPLTDENLYKLLCNYNFLNFVFLTFVDYNSLVGYYGKLNEIITTNSINLKSDQREFFKAIVTLRDVLMTKKIKSINYFKKNMDTFHPILIGRLASLEIAFRVQSNMEYNDVLEDISLKMNSNKNKNMDYLYELNTISLLLADFELMDWICKSMQYSNINESYQLAHQQYFFLVSLILSIKQDDKKNIFKYEKLIKKNERQLSYYDFFELFWLIASYHSNKEKKKEKLNLIRRITTKMNYPIFNDEYIINYFN